jgi:hypothetical protein
LDVIWKKKIKRFWKKRFWKKWNLSG